MKNFASKTLKLAISTGIVIIMSACASTERGPLLDEHTEIAQHKYAVKNDYMIGKFNYADVNASTILDAINRYETNGVGPLYIAMAKDDQMDELTVQRNSDIVNDIASKFNRAGVHNTTIAVAKVETADPDLIVLAYASEEFGLSDECATPNMPGYYGETRVTMDNYKLGCQKSHLMMRQVSDVNDLKGKAPASRTSSAERNSNIISTYYTPGETQEFVPSYIVSELVAN